MKDSKTKAEESTRLPYTRFRGGLEHLKNHSKDRDEMNRREVFECDG